ncbi:MAG: tetratricopeptide repeat protein [Desulfobulbaceae bacterium]|nr:tetratricopeptide repeat protein [Desulfobulbaceae bacterium]
MDSSSLLNCDRQLCAADFGLLARPFIEAISILFPSELHLDFLADDAGIAVAEESGRTLYLPLPLTDGSRPLLRLHSPDTTVTEPISTKWMEEQTNAILHILTLLRPGFIDCASGFYNLRALEYALNLEHGVFFMLHLGCVKKNIIDTLHVCAAAAAVLRHNMDAAFFSCGFGLFAALCKEEDFASARRSARLLQRRLRQEGINRAQILYLGVRQAKAIFAESGLAGFQEYFAEVDKQGPFGVLCASGASEQRCERFRLANGDVFRLLQQKWRGEAVFSLAIFRLESSQDARHTDAFDHACEDAFRAELPLQALRQHGECWLIDPHTLVCFFSGLKPQDVLKKANIMRSTIQHGLPHSSIAVGIAGWPFLNYAKKHIPANCLKALLHASLLGPGQQVVFDHLSLNVSGDSYFEEGDYHHAIREYRRGLQLQPDNVNLLNSLGVTLAAYGQKHQAATCFRKALALEAENHMALANLGYILLHTGKHDEAFFCLEQAYAAFPTTETMPRELLQSLVRLCLEREQFRQALDILEKYAATSAAGNDALYYRQLGLALEGCGDTDKAMRAFEQALKLAPQDAISMGHLGGLYQKSGEGDDLGLHFCEQAIRLERNSPSLWRILGSSYFKQGNLGAAAEAAEHCLRLKHTDAEAMWLAAQICLQKKNTKQARYWLNRASKLHTINNECKDAITRALATVAKKPRARLSTPVHKADAASAAQKTGG